MSLILDALRKADSERERGEVPGLHAQPVAALPTDEAPPARTGSWRWAVAGVAVGLCVPLIWYLSTREPSTTPSAPAVAATSPLPAPAAANAPVAPMLERSATRGSPAATDSPNSAGPATPPASAPPAPSPPRPLDAVSIAEPAPWPRPDVRPPARAPSAATAADGAPATAHASAAPPTLYALEQLPQHIRAELPQLAVSGAIYSPTPRERTVIVNGRLYRENDALAEYLAIEQIRQKSVILRYKGYRFEQLF